MGGGGINLDWNIYNILLNILFTLTYHPDFMKEKYLGVNKTFTAQC